MDDHEARPSLREAMAGFPTGVTIVAGLDEVGAPFGLTVNSFTSLSLDPPLVLVCIGRGSTWHDTLAGGEAFVVNLLAGDQAELARRFAEEPSSGRFDGVSWHGGRNGAPCIDGVGAWLECAVEQVLSGGDHSIVVGRVTHLEATGGPALLFHEGGFSPVGG